MQVAPQWLENSWYLAGLSKSVGKGKLINITLAGEAILIGRAQNSGLFALKDRCPHRGAPLSAGGQAFINNTHCITCPYHGWAFETMSGQCTNIPALSAHDGAAVPAIAAERFPVREINGLIWIFIGDAEMRAAIKRDPSFKPPVSLPSIEVPMQLLPKSVTVVDAPGPYQEAVTGLVDPAHTPFVHQQWWWRKGKAAQEKQKNYQKLDYGFRIPAHAPSSNSLIYKMLGGTPSTQIDFILPAVRIENVQLGTQTVVGLTAITPIDENLNRIFHILYWDVFLLSMLKPVVEAMALSFLKQDAGILALQAGNIISEPGAPLYVGEPDEPAKWLRQLYKAWHDQMKGATPSGFENPVSARTLHWKT